MQVLVVGCLTSCQQDPFETLGVTHLALRCRQALPSSLYSQTNSVLKLGTRASASSHTLWQSLSSEDLQFLMNHCSDQYMEGPNSVFTSLQNIANLCFPI